MYLIQNYESRFLSLPTLIQAYVFNFTHHPDLSDPIGPSTVMRLHNIDTLLFIFYFIIIYFILRYIYSLDLYLSHQREVTV